MPTTLKEVPSNVFLQWLWLLNLAGMAPANQKSICLCPVTSPGHMLMLPRTFLPQRETFLSGVHFASTILVQDGIQQCSSNCTILLPSARVSSGSYATLSRKGVRVRVRLKQVSARFRKKMGSKMEELGNTVSEIE
eukprot:4490328-Pyramimonas_sp.AAC.1